MIKLSTYDKWMLRNWTRVKNIGLLFSFQRTVVPFKAHSESWDSLPVNPYTLWCDTREGNMRPEICKFILSRNLCQGFSSGIIKYFSRGFWAAPQGRDAGAFQKPAKRGLPLLSYVTQGFSPDIVDTHQPFRLRRREAGIRFFKKSLK